VDSDCNDKALFCTSASTCKKYSSVGERCGGFTEAKNENRCEVDLECDYSENDPLIADKPGVCSKKFQGDMEDADESLQSAHPHTLT
jgi:hypothetical protein